MPVYDEYPFFPKAAKRINNKIRLISQAKPLDFLTPLIFFSVLLIVAFIDLAFAVPFYSPRNANLYITFCLALLLFGYTIVDILTRMREAKSRIKMKTSKIKDATDADIEILGLIKSTHKLFKSPVFDLECIAYKTEIEFGDKRHRHSKRTTVLTLEKSIGGIFIDDSSETVFPVKIDIEDFLLEIKQTTKDAQFGNTICKKYNLKNEHPLKRASMKMGHLDRLLVKETIILANTEGMFTGKIKALELEEALNHDEYFEDCSSQSEISITDIPLLSQSKDMFAKYIEMIRQNKSSNENTADEKIRLLFPPGEDNLSSYIACSTRFKDERKDLIKKFISSTFVLGVAVGFMICAFKLNSWV